MLYDYRTRIEYGTHHLLDILSLIPDSTQPLHSYTPCNVSLSRLSKREDVEHSHRRLRYLSSFAPQ